MTERASRRTRRILTPRNGAAIPTGDGSYLTRGCNVYDDHPLVAANRGLFMMAPEGAKVNKRTVVEHPKDRTDAIAEAAALEGETKGSE